MNDLWGNNQWLRGIQAPAVTQPAVAAASPDLAERAQLFASLQEKVNLAMAQSWRIPPSAPPLSASDHRFLRQHTISEFCPPQSSDPVVQFVLGVVQSTLVQVGSSLVQNALFPKETPESVKQEERLNEQVETSREDAGIQASKDHSTKHQGATDQGSTHRDSVSNEGGSHALEGERASSLPDQDAHAKNPAVKQMTKSAQSHVESRVRSVVTKMINETASDADKAFVKHAGKVLGSAAAAGKFLSRVEEIGIAGASAETAQSITVSFLAKSSAKAVTAAVGCTNPVWCAGVVATIFKDLLTPVETAPSNMDMRPPLPPPTLEQVTQSRPIELNPQGPVWRQPLF